MPIKYELPITINEALKLIKTNRILLPAIQRKFVWSHDQICILFDSLMRHYPINTFMFWYVESKDLKKNNRFYEILNNYVERFKETNEYHNTRGDKEPFFAIIDGQQRLTALNIGLRGTYAYRMPRKWWPSVHDEKVLPIRTLYLDLFSKTESDDSDDELRMVYNFQFLTRDEIKKDNDKHHWFEVGKVLDFDDTESIDEVVDVIEPYLNKHGLDADAGRILRRLYTMVWYDEAIHFYKESSQDPDRVLEVFVRANRGGTQLEYSDLLMSLAVSRWSEDARKKIDDLVDVIRLDPRIGYSIDRDYILKACLMLMDTDVKFKISNFTSKVLTNIENEWDQISQCLIQSFELVRSFGITDQGLKAKNATMPIAYYLYHKDGKDGRKLYETINNQAFFVLERKTIRNWLFISLLKQVFSGQGDTVLSGLRKIIKKHLKDDGFPLTGIREAYKGSSKEITFDDDFIDKLLKTQYNDANCFTVLSLLFPDLDYTRPIAKDHLHPKRMFREAELKKNQWIANNAALYAFYKDENNWNSILNLHLLYESVNKSKSGKLLDEWLDSTEIDLTRSGCLISDNTNLSFEKFESFIHDRKNLIINKLKSMFK